METTTLFRVARIENGVKVYWDGSESPYSYGTGSWTSEIRAHYESNPESLQRKVNKKKRQVRRNAERYSRSPEYAAHHLSTFDNAFMEPVEIRPVGRIDLDESL